MTILKLVIESANNNGVEKAYTPALTIQQFKEKLELVTGIEATVQDLAFITESGQTLDTSGLRDDSTLSALDLVSGIHVRVSARPGATGFTENVPKYEMPDDAYDHLSESLREFKRRNKLGRFAPPGAPGSPGGSNETLTEEMQVGRRCQVSVEGMSKRGTVKYVGTTEFKEGPWVGVAYDEPVGKHDGTVQGKSYFSCANKYGAFLRPSKVDIGDFPELLDEEFEEL